MDIHYELELGVVVSGEMRRLWDGEERTLRPGDAWLTGIWEPHGFALNEVPCRVAVFLFRPELFSALHLPVAQPRWFAPFMAPPWERPQFRAQDGAYFLQALKRLDRVAQLQSSPSEAHGQGTAAFLLLLEMLRTLCREWRPSDSPLDMNQWSRIRPALSVVFATREPVSESRAAKACHMSDSTFRRIFKNAVGVSFGKFALHHRLKSAALELRQERTIEDIAERWGFSDISHFYKAFKQVFKQTPAAYRKQRR